MPDPALSARVKSLKPSVTISFMNRAKALKADGVDVLGFAAGEPDFDTPQRIKDAAIAALNAGQTKYMPTLGDTGSRDAIAEKLTRENAIPGLTGNHVAIGSGGKHVLYSCMQCLFDTPAPGTHPQELLLPVPAWVSYAPLAELAGARVVELPTTAASGFKVTPDQLRRSITPRSRCLILCSPSNPCGTMYTQAELRAIASVVAESASIAPDLVVLSDEIYEKITFGGVPHFSIGSVPEIAPRTITLNGLSKAYAMTGWRIGYVAMPGEFGKRFINALGTLQGQMTTNITSFTYPAIRVALTQCADEVERMRQAFAARGELIHRRLSHIAPITCAKPTGAFYAFPDVSGLFGRTTPAGRTLTRAMDVAEALLEEARVAFVPGEDFGGCGGNHVRISFACSESQIERGMDRLAEFVRGLK